ncbi:hypothetical protein DFP72DRAFT_773889, partial [Ephemerocybe angulata]
MQVGTRLRHLFSTLLLFGEPSYPGRLWAEFAPDICSDLAHRIRAMPAFRQLQVIPPAHVHDYGLY